LIPHTLPGDIALAQLHDPIHLIAEESGIMQKPSTAMFSVKDDNALEQLSREFRGSLLRYFARRTHDQSELDDLVQEVFVRLLRRGRTSELIGERLSGYVFETASSVLKDRQRKRMTRCADAHQPFDSDKHFDADFSPEHVLLGKEQLARATAALLELPERTRVIFVLRRLEDMRFKDIAARLNISVSAVEKHMQRAVTHLVKRADRE
jgi:RNA polymerase sigma-70 factor (ECF subfamily)